jgi:TolA-binding protein
MSDSAWRADSLKIAARPLRDSIAVDTLNNVMSRAAAGLGELFYTDLANADSAFYWLKFALRQKYDASNAPRILYILAELAAANPDKSAVTAKEYQDRLLKDFPDSYFAKQLQHAATDQKVRDATVDSAANAYAVAEALIESGKNSEAVAALQKIVMDYPASPVAAKSQYAIGWLYENRLSNMDSAAAEYKLLTARYPSTTYAMAVSGRMLDTLAAVPTKTDSVLETPQAEVQKQDSTRVQQPGIVPGPQKPGAPLSRRARILQSMNQKKIERN